MNKVDEVVESIEHPNVRAALRALTAAMTVAIKDNADGPKTFRYMTAVAHAAKGKDGKERLFGVSFHFATAKSTDFDAASVRTIANYVPTKGDIMRDSLRVLLGGQS